MSILGNAVKGNIADRGSGKVLTLEKVKELQKILLMVLEDIDKLCRGNGIQYILIGGTAIGCIRHKGFIPWDDDVDIAMTRRDYEVFRKLVSEKYPKKYQLTDAIRENNYGKNIPKLRLNGTIYKTLLKIDPNDQEISVDVFIIENVENNWLLKYLHGFACLCMGYALSCRRLANDKDFFEKIYNKKDFKFKVTVGKLLSFASLDKWAHWGERVYSLCRNNESKNVTVPTDRRHFFGEIFPRDIMCETTDAEFEGKKFKVQKAYDVYLTERYGAYMVVPPPEKQVLSMYSKIDFGPYKEMIEK